MKKIKFIFLNTLIIVFISAFFSFAAEVKNNLTPTISAKAASVAAKVPVQSQAKPAPAAAPTQIKQPDISPDAKLSSSTPVPVPASHALKQVDVYSYNPSGKPDPFRPFIVVETVKPQKKAAEKKDKKEPLSIFPLQRAETDKYKVVGIVGSEDHRAAIAEDTAKKFYPLLIGTRIGLHNGKVVEILADRVIVEEYDEKNKATRVILKLRKN
jgi:type IV pilus assembly protein PilP